MSKTSCPLLQNVYCTSFIKKNLDPDLFTSINLSYDGGFIDLSHDGGGGGLKVPPPIFFCENNRKVIRLCTLMKEKDRGIFHIILLSYDWGGGSYVHITDR